MYLLDTNVISAMAPNRRAGNAELADWLERCSPLLYLSTITVAEVVRGIAKADREAPARAVKLREWWQVVEHLYAGRMLAFDLAAARLAGEIMDRARAHDPGFEDFAIAAIAMARGLSVVTFNDRHFEPLGVKVFNPSHGLPSI